MNGSTYIFIASGSGRFPHKLLAQQRCFPESDNDAIRAFEYHGTYRPVSLSGMQAPNENIWKSYGWSVRLVRGIPPTKEDYSEYHTWPC